MKNKYPTEKFLGGFVGSLVGQAACGIGVGFMCNKGNESSIKNELTDTIKSSLKTSNEMKCEQNTSQKTTIKISGVASIGKGSKCNIKNITQEAISTPSATCLASNEAVKVMVNKMKNDLTSKIDQKAQQGFLSSSGKNKSNVKNVVKNFTLSETELNSTTSCLQNTKQNLDVDISDITCLDGGEVDMGSFRQEAISRPIMDCLQKNKTFEDMRKELDNAVDADVEQVSKGFMSDLFDTEWIKYAIIAAAIVACVGIAFGAYKFFGPSGSDSGSESNFMYL